MKFWLCLLLHQSSRTVLVPGVLPFNLDAQMHCSVCDDNRPTTGRETSYHRGLSFGAAA